VLQFYGPSRPIIKPKAYDSNTKLMAILLYTNKLDLVINEKSKLATTCRQFAPINRMMMAILVFFCGE